MTEKSYAEIVKYSAPVAISALKRYRYPNYPLPWLAATGPATIPLSSVYKEHLINLGQIFKSFHDALDDFYESDHTYQQICDEYRSPNFMENMRAAKNLKSSYLFYRPDIILTGGEFRIAEIDGLPGELGQNAFLAQLYEPHYLENILSGYLEILNRLKLHDVVDFVIDDISSYDSYKAEYAYLAEKLNTVGIKFNIHDFKNYNGPAQDGVLVHRFFDMVHNDQQRIKDILDRILITNSFLYPPLKHHIEEKLSLSLIHSVEHESTLLKYISRRCLGVIRHIVPRVWVINKTTSLFYPEPLLVEGEQLASIDDLIEYSKKGNKLKLVLKTSGFSDSNSSSKGATMLENKSAEELNILLKQYIYNFDEHFILQEYIEPTPLTVAFYDPVSHIHTEKSGITRLTPYYFESSSGYDYASSLLAVNLNLDRATAGSFDDNEVVTIGIISE